MKTPIISKKYVMIWRRLRWSGTRPKKVIHHEATFCESAFLWNFFFLGSRHLQGVFLVQPNRFRSYLFLRYYNWGGHHATSRWITSYLFTKTVCLRSQRKRTSGPAFRFHFGRVGHI